MAKAKHNPGRRGFTLLEVLMVSTVIAILVAITLPALGSARKKAQRTSCGAQLHELGIGIQAYLAVQDVNYTMPISAMLPSINVGYEPLPVTLAREVPTPRAWHCPGDTNGYIRQSDGQLFDSFFAGETTSYEYSMSLGGKQVGKAFLNSLLGDSGTFVLADYDAFHDAKGAVNAKNILFSDGHVGNIKDISNALGTPTGPATTP